MNIPDEVVEAAVNAHGQAVNPKWHHPIMGYETFSEDQKEFLRDRARTYLEAAAPYLIAQASEAIAELVKAGMSTEDILSGGLDAALSLAQSVDGSPTEW